MGLPVPVPRTMAELKPPHGSPCNRCGVCCYATLCPLGQHVFSRERGPCPALVRGADGRTHDCGLTAFGTRTGRDAAAVLIGAGTGCDARINGEPVNAAFNLSLEAWDREHAAEVAGARKVWGMLP